jgi:site-specific DNA-cytosine methylase
LPSLQSKSWQHRKKGWADFSEFPLQPLNLFFFFFFQVDISTLNASDLSAFKSNLWLLSPACQPYTVLNPNAKAEGDPRAQSFIHLIRDVLPELASSDEHPARLLVENVAGFEVCFAVQT